MKNLVVIFGGKSVEHDISILTGLHAAQHIENAHVHYVYLTRENMMLTGEELGSIDYYLGNGGKAKQCFFIKNYLYRKGRLGAKKLAQIDAVLNCCHGGVGEKGELAAFFDTLGIPVTSCDYVAAANMQSKIRTKEILTAAGFEQTKYMAIKKQDLETNKNESIENSEIKDSVLSENHNQAIPLVVGTIRKILGETVIVKPDTLGSSIGITVAKTEEELHSALELAFSMDKKVIVEEFLDNIREINCSAMRQGNEIVVSSCELINNKNQFFDFDTKYLDSGSGFIKKVKDKGAGDGRSVNNEEEDSLKNIFNKIQELTRAAYELFDARGVIRADFMVVGEKIYLNEINTVPGFLAYHLWARSGIPYGVMIDMLVKQSIKDNVNVETTVFRSDILLKNRGLIR